MAKRTGSIKKPSAVKRPSQAVLPTQNAPRPARAPAPAPVPKAAPSRQSSPSLTPTRISTRGGGSAAAMATGSAEGLNPELMSRFSAMQAAAAAQGITIGIGSGARSIQEQIDLRISNGCPDIWDSPASSCDVPTAIPGRSNHNHGLAIDFSGDDEADRWVAANAARFGLHLPVPGENWHLEMIEDDVSSPFIQSAMSEGALGSGMQDFMDETNPEDELANRLDSILNIMGQVPGSEMPGIGTSDSPTTVGDTVRFPVSSVPRPGRRTTGGQGVGTGSRADYINYARSRLGAYGWGEGELNALIELWDRESNWNPNAQNPTSSAYGIAQFLNGTWAGVGAKKTNDPYAQIDAGLAYIAGRRQYGSPSRALAFHNRNNWY